jgi:NAD(P)-dependent dehydrogenase (short-subunit alcohol dehydrogenase family)
MACSKIWKGERYANTGAFQAYHRAKLAMVYATYAWAEQVPAAEVTFNAVSPGYFVGTDVFRHCRGFIKFVVKVFRPFFADPEKSAQTYVYLAASPDIAGITGKYWEYCKQKKSSPLSHDIDTRQQLIEWTKAQFDA